MTPDDVRDWAKRNHAIVSVGTVYLTVGERQAVIVASGGNLLAITPHETGAGLYRQDFDWQHAYWHTRYITAWPQYIMTDAEELRRAVFGGH